MDAPLGWEFDATAALVAAPVPLLVTAPRGSVIAFVNEAFSAFAGYGLDECVGRPLDLLRGADTDATTFAEVVRALAFEEAISRDLLLHGKDGRALRVALSARPHTSDGGATIALCDAHGHSPEDEALADLLRHIPCQVFRRVRRADGEVDCFGLPDWIVHPGAPGRRLGPGSCIDDVHPEDLDRVLIEIEESTARLKPLVVEYRARPDGGSGERWLRTQAIPREVSGTAIWDGITFDVTAERERREWLEATTENIPGFIFRRQTAPDGTIVYPYLSASLTRMIGLPEGPLTGDELWKHVHRDDVGRLSNEIRRTERELSKTVIELRILSVDGAEHWFRSYSSPRTLGNGTVVWDGVAVDVTSEKEASLGLEYLARHDALTGLANRAFLAERLRAAIDEARQEQGGALALSHLVLAGLSEINETLGTAEGDAVLREAASRISEVASALGHFAARIGGNEFAVLRKGDGVDADAFVLELLQTLSQPIPVDDGAVLIEPSAGTTVLSAPELKRFETERAAAELMKRASMALSAACRLGAGSHLRYDDSLDHRIQHRMELRHALHRAIEENQLVLHYQPIVDIDTGRIVGAEALVRWQHPQFGLLRPNVFIPLAEESGLIIALGEWVLRTALRQLATWRAAGMTLERLAVNASAIQVRNADFAGTIRRLLAESGIAPQALEIEITEGILLDSAEEVAEALRAIRALGVRLSIDDFGAGHASFQYLRGFPIDQIKLDQMFVRQLSITSSDAVIVRAIASLGRSLGLELVAVGVETRQQRDFLQQQGYPLGQGYLFSPPIAADAFARLLASGAVLPLAGGAPGRTGP